MEDRKNIFKVYLKINLLIKILVGLILGAIIGIIFAFTDLDPAKYIATVQPFGDLFVRLLKMIVIPVILLSLISGAASIAPSRLGKVGIKILGFYLLTSAFAVFIGLMLANIFRPGFELGITGIADVAGRVAEAPTIVQVLLNIIPTNPIASLVKGDVLPIIFFAVIFGIALSFLKEEGNKTAETVLNFTNGCADAMYKIVAAIMQYAPIGVFALVSIVFAIHGHKVIGPLILVSAIAFIGYIIHLIFVYGAILGLNGLSIIKFFTFGNEAMITAFVTRSSGGTLPITLKNVEENMGVPRSIASFTLPLGATINMDGTAIYLGVSAMFIGFATGNPLTFNQQLVVLITATLASIGTAGVPGAGAIMLLMVLESVNLPVSAGSAVAAAYAMILGIDVILDMGRTCLNVTGDMVGTTIVSKSEKELDLSKWK